MHRFLINSTILLSFCLPGLCWAQNGAITLDAASTQINRAKNTVEFNDIVIQYDQLKLEAQFASTNDLDFKNSRWQFNTDVVITEASSIIKATSAEVEFKQNKISEVELKGDPFVINTRLERDIDLQGSNAKLEFKKGQLTKARMRGQPVNVTATPVENQDMVNVITGEGRQLNVDFGLKQVNLKNNARIIDGDNLLEGQNIVYDLAAEKIIAESDNNQQRVHIVFSPKTTPEPPIKTMQNNSDTP